jgi:hypothetical protein
MIALQAFATLVLTALFAAAGAAALHWLMLRATFLLMRPATARRIPVRTDLVRGTAELARPLASDLGGTRIYLAQRERRSARLALRRNAPGKGRKE